MIVKKKIKFEKGKPEDIAKNKRWFFDVRSKLDKYRRGLHIVFCDATLFTSDTISSTAWNLPRQPIKMETKKI